MKISYEIEGIAGKLRKDVPPDLPSKVTYSKARLIK